MPSPVLAAQSTPSLADEGQALFDKAQKLLQEKNYKEAKDILNQLVAKHPMDDFIPKARLILANLQEDFTISTAEFKGLAVEYSDRPEGAEAQKDLGERYYLADKYDEAAESYKEYLDYYPKSPASPEVRYWYASSLLALDSDKEAVEEYQKVLHDAPDGVWAPKAMLGIGNAYSKMKKFDDAQKQYLRLLDQYPLYDELNLVYFKLGQNYESMQKWKEAHAAYLSLLQKYPKAFEVSEARDRLRELESQHPDLPRAVEAQVPESTPTAVPAAAEQAPTPEAAPVPAAEEAESLSKPFHVQVGVYSKKFNVDKTRKLIQKAGYSSYVLMVKPEGAPYTYYKVRVGNYADRAEAEKVARELARKVKEKAIVIED